MWLVDLHGSVLARGLLDWIGADHVRFAVEHLIADVAQRHVACLHEVRQDRSRVDQRERRASIRHQNWKERERSRFFGTSPKGRFGTLRRETVLVLLVQIVLPQHR